MKHIFFILLFFSFSCSFSQRAKHKINQRNGYLTGHMVDGYKHGLWIETYNDRTAGQYYYDMDNLYKKVELHSGYPYSQDYKKIFHYSGTNYRNITIYDSLNNDLKAIDKQMSINSSGTKLMEYKMISYRKVYEYYQLRTSFNFQPALHEVDKELYTDHHKELKIQLPYIDSLELNGDATIKSFIIAYENQKIRYPNTKSSTFEINKADLQKSFKTEDIKFTVSRDGNKWFSFGFKKAIPTLFISYYKNGVTNLSCQFKNGFLDGEFVKKREDNAVILSCNFNQEALNGDLKYTKKSDSENLTTHEWENFTITIPYVNGLVNGKVKSEAYEIDYQNGFRQKFIHYKKGVEKHWAYKNCSYQTHDNETYTVSALSVEYNIDIKTGALKKLSCNTDRFGFSFTTYPSQKMILLNYNEGKSGFTLYKKEDGTYTKHLSIRTNGQVEKKYQQEKFQDQALQFIATNYFNPELINYDKPITYSIEQYGANKKIIYQYPNGKKLMEENYVNNKLHGKRTIWNLKGIVMQIAHFNHGIPHGKYTMNDEFGNSINTGNYSFGLEVGKWLNHKGNIIYHVHYNNKGEVVRNLTTTKSGKNLSLKEFNEDRSYTYYKYDTISKKPKHIWKHNHNGKLHGISIYYDDNGYKQESRYVNGYKHGTWKKYNKQGEVVEENTYSYGRVVLKPNNQYKCECPGEFNVKKGPIYFPRMEDLISYKEMNQALNNYFKIDPRAFNRTFWGGLMNEDSGNGANRFLDVQLVSFDKDFHLDVVNSNTKLYLIPCLNKGEIGKRDITISSTKSALNTDYRTSLGKGYYAIESPLLTVHDDPSKIIFKSDGIDIKKKLKIINSSEICTHKKLEIKGKSIAIKTISKIWIDENSMISLSGVIQINNHDFNAEIKLVKNKIKVFINETEKKIKTNWLKKRGIKKSKEKNMIILTIS